MKLDPAAADTVRAWLAGGKSYAEIANSLRSSHGITISREAIGKFARQNKALRADAAKEAVRGQIVASIEKDLAIFDEQRAKFLLVLEKQHKLAIKNAKERRLYAQLFEEYRQSLAAKVKWSGAEEPDADIVSGIADLLGLAFEEERDIDDDAQPTPAASATAPTESGPVE